MRYLLALLSLIITTTVFSQVGTLRGHTVYSTDYWKTENMTIFESTRDSLSIKWDDETVYFTMPKSGETTRTLFDQTIKEDEKNVVYLYVSEHEEYADISWVNVIYENDSREKGDEKSIVFFYEDGTIDWWDIKD